MHCKNILPALKAHILLVQSLKLGDIVVVKFTEITEMYK